MSKEYVNPSSLFRSLDHGFSQAVVASGRRTLYVSGQTAWDEHKRLIGGDNLEEQAKQAMRNIETAVEAIGGSWNDIVNLRIYIVNYQQEKATAVHIALREYLRTPDKPAMTWIGVTALADPGFLIEIEAIGVLE